MAADYGERIEAAFAALGVEAGLLDWNRAHATEPLRSLLVLLKFPAPPVFFRQYLGERAAEAGRYDEFVRVEAVRELWEHVPSGTLMNTMWPGMFEAALLPAGRAVWQRLLQTVDANPAWLPADIDDPLLARAFDGHTFAPTEGGRRLAEIVKRIDEAWIHDNSTGSKEKAFANLTALPIGYLIVHSLFVVDGEICNGGFAQLFDNGYGYAVAAAVRGFRMLGREDLAAVVAEADTSDAEDFHRLSRDYFALVNGEPVGWLETAIISRIVMAEGHLFEP